MWWEGEHFICYIALFLPFSYDIFVFIATLIITEVKEKS